MLVEGTVRYKCIDPKCGHLHKNSDKVWMMARGEWVPTAKPKSKGVRSYHLSALYAPVFAKSWESCVVQYLTAWDVQRNRPKDMGLFQVFRNNVLGKTYSERGQAVRFEQVSAHRRHEYQFKQIPNISIAAWTGHPLTLLTCAVDVQDEYLSVGVVGWTEGWRAFLIEYFELKGDTSNRENPDTWGALSAFIENTEYTADDGRKYIIDLTVVDAGHQNEVVTGFCSQYTQGVYPIIGRAPTKNQQIKEFRPWVTQMGTQGYAINVDLYKERWANALKKNWDGVTRQPATFFNVPSDCTDAQLRELTREVRRERIEKRSGRREGYEWHRMGGGAAKNELWDLLVYNNAALELIAWHICVQEFEMDYVDWPNFWLFYNDNRVYNPDN